MTREESQSDKGLSSNHELDPLRLFRISRQRLECAASPRFGSHLLHGVNAYAKAKKSSHRPSLPPV